MNLLDFHIICRGDMLFATVVPIAYLLLYFKNRQKTFVFVKFVMAFAFCLYWVTYAFTFAYSYYDIVGWFKVLIIPILSLYCGMVLLWLRSKRCMVFFFVTLLYILLGGLLILWHYMSDM